MQFIYKPLDDGASGNRGRHTTRWAEECGIRNQFDSSSSAKSLEDVVFPGTVKKTGQLRPVVAHFISLCSFVIHVEVLLSLSQCMWPSFLILLCLLLQTELYSAIHPWSTFSAMCTWICWVRAYRERHWLRLWMKFPTRSLHHHISNTRPICIVDWSLIVGNVLVAHFQLTALTSCVTTEQTRSTTGQWPDQSTQRQASCRFIKNLFSFLFILAHYEVKENYHKEVA